MRKAVLITGLLLPAIIVFARPVVVDTLGPTVNAERFIPTMILPQHITTPSITKTQINQNFTVQSRLLTESNVVTHKNTQPVFGEPVYLVGDDARSIAWITRYKPQLTAIHARGYLVNVNGRAAYQQVVKQTGMHLLPISGDGFAKAYGVRHYPVLITQHLIEQ